MTCTDCGQEKPAQTTRDPDLRFVCAECREKRIRKRLADAEEVLRKISLNKTDDCEIYTMGCDCDDEAKDYFKRWEIT